MGAQPTAGKRRYAHVSNGCRARGHTGAPRAACHETVLPGPGLRPRAATIGEARVAYEVGITIGAHVRCNAAESDMYTV